MLGDILRLLAVILLFVSLVACDGGTLWEDGKYQVIWIDASPPYLAECDPGMCKDITGERILSVGSDDRYIVSEFQEKKDGQSSFYIIDKSISGFNARTDLPKSVTGPYSKEKFDMKAAELKLPEFSKHF